MAVGQGPRSYSHKMRKNLFEKTSITSEIYEFQLDKKRLPYSNLVSEISKKSLA